MGKWKYRNTAHLECKHYNKSTYKVSKAEDGVINCWHSGRQREVQAGRTTWAGMKEQDYLEK